MKKIEIQTLKLLRFVIPAMAIGLLLNVSSCSKTETNKPAPTVTVNPATISNVAGAVVTSTVHVDAPEGGKLLTILVNGAANTTLPDVALSGTAQDVPVSFTIPANATVGASYVITFQATDNKNQVSIAGFFTVAVASVAPKTIVDVPTGNITGTVNWTKDKIYRLNGYVRVGTDAKPSGSSANELPVIGTTGTLNIEAGTVIYGKTGTPGGTLIVQRGGKINAIGTAAAPIIFTSEKAPGSKKAGDWGGVVICGQANENVKGALTGGTNFVEELEGGYQAYFGGTNDADNSGTLKYVRIEFAGYPINPNQEINGLTMGAVGSATTVSYVQVSYSNDDSFEWFGGTVNVDHIVAYKGLDDDFDTDYGYSGYVQYGLAIRDALIADQSGSNGFESDNNGISDDQTPRTAAKFSNMTMLGGKAAFNTSINVQFQHVAQIRRYSEIDIYNSFFTGWPTGVYIDGNRPSGQNGAGGSVDKANAGTVELKNNILAGVENWGGNGFGRAANADEIAQVTAPAVGTFRFGTNAEFGAPPRGRVAFAGDAAWSNGVFDPVNGATTTQAITGVTALAWFKTSNAVMARWQDAGVSATAFDPLGGTPTLVGSGALLTGASFTGLTIAGTPGSPNAGFQSVAYRGAFGATDWTTGWANWNPQATDYSK